MVLLFWVGSFWREDDVRRRRLACHDERTTAPACRRGVLAIAAACGRRSSAALAARCRRRLERAVHDAGACAWRRSKAQAAGRARRAAGYHGSPATRAMPGPCRRRSDKAAARRPCYLAYYRDQRKGRELVTSSNLLVAREDFQWKPMKERDRGDRLVGQAHRCTCARARSAPRTPRGAVACTGWTASVTASEYVRQGAGSHGRALTGHGDDAALVVIYTPLVDGDGAADVARCAMFRCDVADDRPRARGHPRRGAA